MLDIEIIKGNINCPFHNDSKPSMKVYSDHVYCFACGAYKKTIKFTMEYLSLSFKEALLFLADKFNIDISSNTEQPHHIITRKEIKSITDMEYETCIEYHKRLIDSYNDYLDINNQYGYLKESYESDRQKNDELLFNIHQYGIDSIIHNIKYIKKIEKILQENWEIIDIKDIYAKILSNKRFAKSLSYSLKQNGGYI